MPDSEAPSSDHWEVSPSNLPFVEELYLSYQQDPASVDETWRLRFEKLERGGNGVEKATRENGHHPKAAPAWAPANGHAVEPVAIVRGSPGEDVASAAAQRAIAGKRVRRLI